jgi:hypothetical protein
MAARFESCAVMRRMLVKHGLININTGETRSGPEEWITRACDTPLFTEPERTSGKCRACAKGWTHPHNYPIEAKGAD